MAEIFGYGEDALTLWALKKRISDCSYNKRYCRKS